MDSCDEMHFQETSFSLGVTGKRLLGVWGKIGRKDMERWEYSPGLLMGCSFTEKKIAHLKIYKQERKRERKKRKKGRKEKEKERKKKRKEEGEGEGGGSWNPIFLPRVMVTFLGLFFFFFLHFFSFSAHHSSSFNPMKLMTC